MEQRRFFVGDLSKANTKWCCVVRPSLSEIIQWIFPIRSGVLSVATRRQHSSSGCNSATPADFGSISYDVICYCRAPKQL
ncbi:unnamed protein product [Hermetia illucens]|uniref:Uncharacterized protein n=1 Tax=Hermetia illucens TaxID=343691 RepID=A0A7R8YP57_HERIL|nr:unnamed protein product [Hermetia illucens]